MTLPPSSIPATADSGGSPETNRSDERKPRSDGIEARERLLRTALRLFSEKGFAKASTREIALAAGTNIASISYYFGDKQGLYRAAFTEPLGSHADLVPLYDQPHFSLRESLEGYFTSFLAPLKQDELIQQCTRLHFREMLEPTGLWKEEIDKGIKPAHAALAGMLARHLGRKQADDDVHRLAFSITGLALQMYIARDVVQAIRPQLIGSEAAIDQWSARLADYAEAMVDLERQGRGANTVADSPSLSNNKKNP